VTKAPSPADSSLELPADRALRRVAERLQRAVSELPLRYAPFYGRLSNLWQVSEEQVKSELTRARDAAGWSPTVLPGLRVFDIRAGGLSSAHHARLLKFSPDARFPRHRHHGREQVLVLEGGYADADGHEVHAGDEQMMDAGSEHELHIIGGGPCVVAISEQGIAFTSPWLRWLNPLLR